MRRNLTLWLASLAATFAPGVASAKVRALVVGVSNYERADLSDAALPGAASDAAAVAARLRDRSGSVTLLTGDVARAGAILDALHGLAGASEPGDRLVVYLAGHGVQAPSRARDEPDGLDEWFLAADAGSWDARRRDLPGAIRDKAIGEAIATARARGADVWLIIDACSGGGLSRGSAGVPRAIDPARIGITGTLRGSVPDNGGIIDTATVPGSGRLVLFQAARSGEVAWERTLTNEAGGTARRGLFTWALLRAWRSLDEKGSFADLAAATDRERIAAGPPGGAALIGGDIAQPVLFSGAARDLLTVARTGRPLDIDIRIGIGAASARCPGGPAARTAPVSDAPIRVRGCRSVAVELASPAHTGQVVAWYRDAKGEMISLLGATPRRIGPDEPVTFDFVVSDRDPATDAQLPTGREQLILLDASGMRGKVVEFDTGSDSTPPKRNRLPVR